MTFILTPSLNLRPGLPSKFDIPRISFRYLASLSLITAIMLIGHTTVVIKTVNQSRVAQSSHECIHNIRPIPNMDKSTGSRAASFTTEEQTIILDNYDEVKHIIQTKSKLQLQCRKDSWQTKSLT